MNIDCLAEICYKPLGDEKGEDAYAYNIARDDLHTIAVFDGCGGSGAWKYPEFHHASGAFVAAQSMAKGYLGWFDSVSAEDLHDPDTLSQSFLDYSRDILTQLKQSCAPMGVSGSLVKSFPCTASAAVISQEQKDSIGITALNTGDSRVYCLVPGNGLIQLTKDDSRGNPDPLDSLRDNPPLSNMMNADKPYRVSVRQVVLPAPCAVICATDGVFGFVRSPMDFEYLLLKCILFSESAADFERQLQDEVVKITGDDSTCVAAFYGWGSYPEIKRSLEPRFRQVQGIINSIDKARTAEERESVIRAEWETYRKSTVYDEMQG